ncbi:beta-ketoacyl-[acyl-carrier-protein] synthase family protein [Nocardia bovistercoris]|uniref:Beta-ketoacyl-[acyl-carrier-protein] synthase family protein n=1 Tax=Nocardia bovistercoris TaxID=2785916 RepID=A0A931MYW2_9NOCA|nr:beta-ketoacyl-[acyl-carrier-protein] synthase family protein [Nocardia bovistercoris]MBH0775475.1 beta-ketoacyl-[acyl-carrier-protein] synthase family protein [Nocardia bovistercoris]
MNGGHGRRAQRDVVVTGIGAVTPVGNTAPDTWSALAAGISGIGRISTFDPGSFSVRIAGQVRDLPDAPAAMDLSRWELLTRAGRFGVVAAAEAVADAGGFAAHHEPGNRGVFVGGHVGRPEPEELAQIGLVRRRSAGAEIHRRDPESTLRCDQGVDLAAIAEVAGCRGPISGISTACASATHAIGEAMRRIQAGEITMAVAGGQDSLTTWLDVSGFALLGALTTRYNDDPTRASRPFDAERDGFVLGEGSVLMVLEDRRIAEVRGARILGRVSGYASTMNAYRITDSPPDGGGSITAMANAIADAGVEPDAVDCVYAHGTSTPGNDISETAAIKKVFGAHAYELLVTSPKSMTGHLTAGAGALNVLGALYGFRDGLVTPTINLEHPDPKLDLDYVPNHARASEVSTAVVNSFAFGGTNASLVLEAP